MFYENFGYLSFWLKSTYPSLLCPTPTCPTRQHTTSFHVGQLSIGQHGIGQIALTPKLPSIDLRRIIELTLLIKQTFSPKLNSVNFCNNQSGFELIADG